MNKTEETIFELLGEMNVMVPADDRYVNAQGINVPRVTTILSEMTRGEGIVRWSNKLGFKGIRYEDELNKASMRGTVAHGKIESFLMGESKPEDDSNISLQAFKKWFAMLTANHTYETVAMEEKLVCQWFGGTFDLLCKIDGRYWLVDFKTSNHITAKYIMQLAAYVYMLRCRGISVSGVIILQLSKTAPEYNEYVLDFCNYSDKIYFDECTRAFFSLVYAYYNKMNIEEKFTKRW